MGPVKEPNIAEQLLVSLGHVLQTLREADDTQALIDTTLAYLKNQFAEHYGLIWLGLYDRLDHRLVGKGGILPKGSTETLKQRFNLTSGDLLEQVVMQQRPVAVADMRQESRARNWQQIADRQGIQGTMIFPLTHRGLCLGVIMLGCKTWGTFPNTQEKAALVMVMGEVAAILERVETDWQKQQIKRPDQPLLRLTDRLRSLTHLGQRLEAAIEESHKFIGGSRTSVYWYEPKQRYFWRRVSNQNRNASLLDSQSANSGITVQEVTPFYQSLLNDQLVTINREYSSVRSDIGQRLLNLLRAKSLMIAPILYQRELMGFISVEGSENRNWQVEEQQYLKATAQLLALAAPLEEMETVMQQSQLDNGLITDISQSLYSKTDWRQTVTRTAELLSKRLKSDRLIVILHNPETDQYDICYQTHPRNRRPLNKQLPPLSQLDHQLVERQSETLTIENWEDDLRLTTWRPILMELGIKSSMICSTSPGQALEGVLVIGNETCRSWTNAEANLFQIASQQLGLILHQWQLQRQQQQSQSLQTNLQQAVERMQGFNRTDELEWFALNSLSKVTESPLALLLAWFPGDTTAQVIRPNDLMDKRFNIQTEPIEIESDPLIQEILAQPGLNHREIDQLPSRTREWFQLKLKGNQPEAGRIMAMALHSHSNMASPIGIVLVADIGNRHWSDRHQLAFETLSHQLAWCRRSIRLGRRFHEQHNQLAQLSWYKQRHIEAASQSLSSGIQRLLDMKPSQDRLAITRQQQILRQMQDALAPLEQMLEGEFWEFQFKSDPMPLIGLLRRTLDRVDRVVKARQLWMQVHHDGNPLVLGDAKKLEFILYEILCGACQRSAISSRVDIWCRQVDSSWIEVAITDSSDLDNQLIEAINHGHSWDNLNPSPMDQREGRHLMICKMLAQSMGADFSIFPLEDQRIMSRIILPIADSSR
ncbi:GAF domain-containing protein [filamentous cyanobacterium LEGE 11480]|uniref:GAF domain-containing protein n=1 Tax=Romeriopsis navalis LEGE 11480 TaxID=2777977 RepID=A0A928Z4N3_9CYAN|nr:GAF domain-containing protein [Romeriopsis navalis]MBE9030543.1 GAF domain-containing protein [Romeriopsis navalis LEGE 11480]